VHKVWPMGHVRPTTGCHVACDIQQKKRMMRTVKDFVSVDNQHPYRYPEARCSCATIAVTVTELEPVVKVRG